MALMEYHLLSNNDVFAPYLVHVQPHDRDLQVGHRLFSRRSDSAMTLDVLCMLVRGALFIAGLSECGAEFHLGTLLSVSERDGHEVAQRPNSRWPKSKRHLHIYRIMPN